MFPYECFRNCETKKFKRKSWYTPKMLKSFRNPKSVKHQLVPPPKVSATWDKAISTQSRYSLFPKNFDTRTFLKHRWVHLWNFLGQWDKKILSETRDIPFLCLIFANTRKLVTHWSVAPRNFSVPWDKESSKRLYSSYPKKKQKSSWNTEGFPYRQKTTIPSISPSLSLPLSLSPSLTHKNLRYQNFSETQLCSSINFFRTARQSSFNRKSWYATCPKVFW